MYKFSWSNDSKDSLLTNTKIGKYGLKIEDKFSCKFDTNNILLRYNTSPRITVDSISHPTCYGADNGFVSMKIQDNNKLTKIFWNTKQTNTIYNSNMKAGSYIVKVFNEANCVDSAEVMLSAPDSLKIGSTFTNETLKEKGDIFLFVSGGVQPYSYFWNDSLTTKNRIQIDGDKTYSVEVKDANGCLKMKEFKIQKLLDISDLIEDDVYDIYPNPSSGEVFIMSGENLHVIVENFEGKHINSFFLDESIKKIDLSDFNKGLYLFRIIGKNYSVTRKISII